VFGSRGCEAGWGAGESYGFSGRESYEVYGVDEKCDLSVAAGVEWGAYVAGSWVDGYRDALQYGDYADVGVYDFGGVCEEVGI